MSIDGIPQSAPVKIKIENKGITYVLKSLVEAQKMESSDGKITLKEWNDTMDKLAEIQQKRVQEKKPSIFSGGTDKTKAGWQTSFVVHKGQEIEFTKEEMDMLYSAMGVKFSANSEKAPESSTETVAPVVVESAAGKKSEKGQKGVKSDGKITQEKRKTDSGVEYLADIKDGKVIKGTFYEDDGKTVNSYTNVEYDTAGNKSKETNFRADNTKSWESDYKDGKVIKGTIYEDDGKTIDRYYTSEYDTAGNKSKETNFRADNTKSRESDYKDGKVIKGTFYEDDGKTVNSYTNVEYDTTGNKSKETKFRADNTKSLESEYNDGKSIKSTSYQADGKTIDKLVEHGNLSYQRINSTDANGKSISYKYEFDENGVCTKSELANALNQQIEGPSLNSKTIALLKQINAQNVIKVLSAYKLIGKEGLRDAVFAEWGLGNAELNEYIHKLLEERVAQLDPDSKITRYEEMVEKYAAADTEYTKNNE